ncbi:hypothetical protein OG875_13795 [Streptomyces sp. NBC_01498]|nr:hypothetical protein [Streptomyces sp. NBC_01498]WTL25573.1 hypothetical protein OG875_13795 [Streptomyces sp. NBC_01498]
MAETITPETDEPETIEPSGEPTGGNQGTDDAEPLDLVGALLAA